MIQRKSHFRFLKLAIFLILSTLVSMTVMLTPSVADEVIVPTNLRWDGTIARWDAPADYTGEYAVTLYGSDTSTKFSNMWVVKQYDVTTSTSLYLGYEIYATMNYRFEVKCKQTNGNFEGLTYSPERTKTAELDTLTVSYKSINKYNGTCNFNFSGAPADDYYVRVLKNGGQVGTMDFSRSHSLWGYYDYDLTSFVNVFGSGTYEVEAYSCLKQGVPVYMAYGKSEPVTLNRLTGITKTGDTLSWDAFPGAATYFVKTYCNGNKSTETENTSISISEFCRTQHFPSGTYEFIVIALDEDEKPLTVATEKLSFNYISSATQLAAPTGLTWDGAIMKWNSVENADYYNVYLYKSDSYTGTSWSFYGGETSQKASVDYGEEYKFKVIAFPAYNDYDHFQSEEAFSEMKTFNGGVPELTGLTITDDKLTFDTIDGKLNGKTVEEIDLGISGTGYILRGKNATLPIDLLNMLTGSGLESGTYSLSVNVYGPNGEPLAPKKTISYELDADKLTPPLSGTVTVTGTAKVGCTLTATLTDANYSNAQRFTWYRVYDEVAYLAKSTSDSDSYTVISSDVGCTIYCTVSMVDVKGYVKSAETAVVIKQDSPAAPSGVNAVGCTTSANNDGQITGVSKGMEYRIGSGEWLGINVTTLSGLSNGVYEIRYQETNETYAGASIFVTVAAYIAPTKYAINTTDCIAKVDGVAISETAEGVTITITANPPAAGMLFDQWTGNVIFANMSASETTFVMPAEAVTVTALYKGVPLTATVTVTGTPVFGGTLTCSVTETNNTGSLSYQWYRGSALIEGATENEYVLTANDIGRTLTVHVTSSVQSGEVTATSSEIQKAERSAPEGIGSTACTTGDNNDGTLTGVSPEMEYKKNDGEWTSISGTTVTNLKSGSYSVRYKETETQKPSPSYQIVVPSCLTDHTHTIEKVNAVPHTCSADGVLEHFHCTECGELFADANALSSLTTAQIVDKAAHSLDIFRPTVSATCTKSGKSLHYECSVCHALFDENKAETAENKLILPVDDTNHSYHWIDATASTCATPGVTGHYECTECHSLFDTNKQKVQASALQLPLTPEGHVFEAWVPEVPATNEANGVKGHKDCSECHGHFDANGKILSDLVIPKTEKKQYTVSYDPNGGYGTMNTDTVTEGDTYTLPANGFTMAEGFVFSAWLVGEETKKPGDTITITSYITIKAIWIENKPVVPKKEDIVTENGVSSFTADVETAKEVGIDVTSLFSLAKEESGAVKVSIGETSLVFDSSAVSAIGGANVSLKVNTDAKLDSLPEAKLVIEITLEGATFENGEATVKMPFTEEVPEGKVAKVYYIDANGNKTDMNATFEGGEVVFKTTHFSTYAVLFEDYVPELPEENGLSAGAIVVIVIGSVLLALAAAYFALGFTLYKKGKLTAKFFTVIYKWIH